MVSGHEQTRSVRAEVNYVRNRPSPGDPPLVFVTEDETRSTMETRPGTIVSIEDVRGRATSLDAEGFVCVPHRSAVDDLEAIEEDPAVDAQYGDEMEVFVRELVGADVVLMLGGGKKRYGEGSTDKLASLTNARPARYPHGDVTDESGPSLAVGMARGFGYDLGQFSRWAMYNIWRSFTPPPQDFPLAVCDARTIGDQDATTVVARTAVRGGGGDFDFDTSGYLHSPRHRWCYVSNMTPDEVLVFKTHDTDPARAHRVAHTAFTDPTCPTGTPTRGSVEARALALFR